MVLVRNFPISVRKSRSKFNACDGSCCPALTLTLTLKKSRWRSDNFPFIFQHVFCLFYFLRPLQDLNFDIDVKLSLGLIKKIHRVQQKWKWEEPRNKATELGPFVSSLLWVFLSAYFLFLRISALCFRSITPEWLDLRTNTSSTGPNSRIRIPELHWGLRLPEVGTCTACGKYFGI